MYRVYVVLNFKMFFSVYEIFYGTFFGPILTLFTLQGLYLIVLLYLYLIITDLCLLKPNSVIIIKLNMLKYSLQ